MSWQAAILCGLALVLLVGGVWFERSRPSARIVAAVAALAALGVAGRLVLAPIPNVVATTDVVLIAGYALGGSAGFAVGSLSALISNFWLGQGPWTPWQMAGWGLVGVGGAILARLSGRRLGRLGLAAAGFVAGLAYGALLDLSTMVSFGGEQSLERYLALSARGIPFNIAHAIGNAAIMLAAGPALVRIVDRYRDRFEVEWEPRLAGGSIAAVLVCATLATSLLGAGGPGGTVETATAGTPVATASSNNGATWLRKAQNKDGGYGTTPGSTSNPGMTGWAMLGLEAAGINPLDVRTKGKTPVDFLREDAGDIDSTGDLERSILALRGAGIGVTNFGGRNLLSELRSRQSGNGSYDKQVNLTAFAILARVAAGDSASSLGKPAKWLRKAQNKDGGWASVANGPSEPDSTGSALQALSLVGSRRPLSGGASWLKRNQNGDGGWSLVKGSGSNAQSTAWAIQGLVAAGANPGASKGSRSGLDYLDSRRVSDGHYTYSKSSDQTPVWVTAQALTGVKREAFPISPVARKPHKAKQSGSGDGSGLGSGGSGSGSGESGSPGAGSGSGAGGGQGREGGSGNRSGGSGASDSGSAGGGRQASSDATIAAEDAPPEVLGVNAAETGDEAGDGKGGGSPALLIGALAILGGALAAGWLGYRGRL